MIPTRKKLIEVALPLEAINTASAREKSIRHGHPSTLHLWWARRPLAAARAVIFAQMVDDPSGYVEELRADADGVRAAERELGRRREGWAQRTEEYAAAEAAGSAHLLAEPGEAPTLDECLADRERERLFELIERLVKWENTTNEAVLEEARAEIRRSWRRTCRDHAGDARSAELFDPQKLPAFHDPFAGGGALPLEAQRLGLESFASDLNPVAVTINKAMIEIPPRFAGRSPVGPRLAGDRQAGLAEDWGGAKGLAEDVRRYGAWMRAEAERRIGALYPKITVTPEMVAERPDLAPLQGQALTVIAWLWARTVRSPNPAFSGVEVPLASTFVLSSKEGKQAYVEPVIDGQDYHFTVRTGAPNDAAKLGTKAAGRGANFSCLMSGSPITGNYIKAQGQAGCMGARLMAIVAEGVRGRVYLAPTDEHESIAANVTPSWKPDVEFFQQALGFRVGNYGMTRWSDLFTPRQLVALTSFSDLIQEAIERCRQDALAVHMTDDGVNLDAGGCGATAYAEAVGVYLAFGVTRSADFWSSLCTWANQPKNELVAHVFTRQALPITWDFAEANPFSESGGNFEGNLRYVAKGVDLLPMNGVGKSLQADAKNQTISQNKVISSDPPYYDNIGYADLSDYFYMWSRRSLRAVFPELYATVEVPKADELVATPGRHGSKSGAEAFFLKGMTQAMLNMAKQTHQAFPVTIYYAFKQAETEPNSGTSSTGWETFLQAVLKAGFSITGTWPMRTEREARSRGIGANALASSIVLVCRRRPADAPSATRRQFLQALKTELPDALAHLQRGNIAPVDLAQAAIGPGMAVFTRHAQVLNADGSAMSVREALARINETLDEALAAQEGDFDADTRWAITWFDQHGFGEGEFGTANVLAQAKNTGVAGLEEGGIVSAGRGKVRLLKPDELAPGWNPLADTRLSAWETVHQLIRALDTGGESLAAARVSQLGSRAESARELAYRLYSLCERRKRAAEGLRYNALVQSWPEIVRLAAEAPMVPAPIGTAAQAGLLDIDPQETQP